MEKYKIVWGDIEGRRVYEYEHYGITYFLETAWKQEIVDYDEYLNNIESSHIKLLDYNVVTGYIGNQSEIDLTWVLPEDEIRLNFNPEIKKVYLNAQNINYTYFLGEEKFDCDITLDSNFIKAVKDINSFLKQNANRLTMINFRNVTNPMFKAWVTSACGRLNIRVTFSDSMDRSKS